MLQNLDILIRHDAIQKRVKELAQEIEKNYQGRPLVVVGVLKGAFIFMADLVRHIEMPLACDFLRVSSYNKDRSTGVVRMDFDMTQPIVGKDVLLVEDIVDSGRTLSYLLKHMETKKPSSLKVCSFLYKETGAGMRARVDYIGFDVPDRYVVGYGLDSEGLYRSLPYVGAFKE
ncbi:MAG: hypoxanthine phosphoribosyltransferase [Deltaproteobacteria bacterium]|nr:hypoxanthine phosphoribosyltransferase [Deltaproteobacteria bacterium]MDZ4225016.1 hypoxanthine phosphoribosyltransferase [bacterium]